jgi:hypothetical protein
MITVDQIRYALQQVILSEISLDDFDEWIAKASWNMHQDASIEAMQLVGKIELILADHDNGHISDAEVVQAFRKLNSIFVLSNVDVVFISTSGSSVPGVIPPSAQWVVFDKSPAAAHACTPALRG